MVPSIACQHSHFSEKNELALSCKSITTKVFVNDEAPSQIVYTHLMLQSLPVQQSTIVTNPMYCNSGMRLSNHHNII